MKRVFWQCVVIAICFVQTQLTYGQSGKLIGRERIDSLEKEVKNVSGTKKADLLNDLAYEWFSFDNLKAFEKASQAFTMSLEINYLQGQAQAAIYKGLYERVAGDQNLANKNFLEGIALAKKSGNTSVLGYGYNQYAAYLLSHGKMDSAAWCYDESYEILKDSLNPRPLAGLYKTKAIYYERLNNYAQQYKWLLRSLAIRKLLKDPLLLSDTYLKLAAYYINVKDYANAEKYLKLAEEQQVFLGGDLESLNDLKYHRAILYFRQLRYTEALSLYNEAKNYFRINMPRHDYIQILIDVAYILSDLGNYELSLGNCYEALALAEKNNFHLEQAKLLWQIGWVYSSLRQSSVAKEFTNKSLEITTKNKFKLEQSFAYNLLGIIYENDTQFDSAIYFYNNALVLREELNDKARVASTLNNIGSVLEQQNRYIDALQYQLRSLKLEESIDNSIGVAWTNLSIGQLYYKMNQIEKALIYLNKVEQYALKTSIKQMLSDVYKVKAKLYEQMGNLPMSLKYFNGYDQLRDSLITSSLTNRIAGLQSEYSLLQKNQQIEILNKDKELRDAELSIQEGRVRQQRLIIVLGSFIFVLLVAVVLYFYRNLKRIKALYRTIQENSEEIQAQAEELQLSNQTIGRINEGLEQMVETRTKELKQAYKELDTFFYRSSHDFRRPLTTFMGLAEVAKITVKDDVALGLFEKVNETARSLDKMLIKLQSISDVGSLQLIYKEIFMAEMFSAVEDTFRDELKAKDIRIVTDVRTPESFFSYAALIKVIIENLVENAIMFSEYHQVIKLVAESDKNGLTIQITDSGWGIEKEYIGQVFDMYFRAHERSKGNGLGLYIVKKITEKLTGTINLESTVGKGTSVKLFFPHKISQTAVS
jgi:signal transduction histidine kinase